MEYPLAEVIDRLTILDLKRTRLPADQTIVNEANRLRRAAFETPIAPQQIVGWLTALLNANSRIWDLESDIRRGYVLGLEEVGRRALAIRKINAERVRIKAEIACAVGEFAETKVDHVSACEP